MDLKEEKAIGGDPTSHWYYIAKGRAIRSLLGGRPAASLLDVGAGSGVFSNMLVREGLAGRALCVDPNYADDALGASDDGKVVYTRETGDAGADLVLMIDVIEHVDDDVGLVRDYANRAAPGTRFLISVPAFQFLWSSHDDFLDHKRRYTLESLEETVRAAGLEPLEKKFFFGLIFPVAAAMRMSERKSDAPPRASQLKKLPGWLNQMLIALHDVERNTVFPINRLGGVTAFCLAEKPMEAAAQMELRKAS